MADVVARDVPASLPQSSAALLPPAFDRSRLLSPLPYSTMYAPPSPGSHVDRPHTLDPALPDQPSLAHQQAHQPHQSHQPSQHPVVSTTVHKPPSTPSDAPPHPHPHAHSHSRPPSTPDASFAPPLDLHPPMYNLVTSFADMSLSPMQYTPSLPLIPLQPHPGMSIPPPPHLSHPPHALMHHASTYEVWVPQDRVGAVIGEKGAVIKSLQERSGATIQVHNDTMRGDLKLFTIKGTRSEYESAAKLVKDIVDRPRTSSHVSSSSTPISEKSRYSPQTFLHTPPSDHYKEVFVPTSCVGLVIGRNGDTIRNLQDKSGAEIKVTPDEEALPDAENRAVRITGTPEAISHAHQLVSEIVKEGLSRRTHPNANLGTTMNGHRIIMEVLAIPNDKVGLIIGRKGVTIRDLQQKSGAKIQVAKDDNSVHSDGTRPVTIVGIRSNVDEAKALIANKINVPYLPSNPVPSFQSPTSVPRTMPAPPTPGHTIPYVYQPHAFDAEFANGQSHFQQPFEPGDPNAPNRPPVAYFPYVGYGNMAAIPQQPRPFPPSMTMPYGHPQQPLQQPQPQQDSSAVQGSGADSQDSPNQAQFASPTIAHMQGIEAIPGSPGLVPRDHNGNVLLYPGHAYPALPQMHGQQLFPPPPNARIYPRDHATAQVAHAHAHAQMMMQARAAQVQMHAQTQASQVSVTQTQGSEMQRLEEEDNKNVITTEETDEDASKTAAVNQNDEQLVVAKESKSEDPANGLPS